MRDEAQLQGLSPPSSTRRFAPLGPQACVPFRESPATQIYFLNGHQVLKKSATALLTLHVIWNQPSYVARGVTHLGALTSAFRETNVISNSPHECVAVFSGILPVLLLPTPCFPARKDRIAHDTGASMRWKGESPDVRVQGLSGGEEKELYTSRQDFDTLHSAREPSSFATRATS